MAADAIARIQSLVARERALAGAGLGELDFAGMERETGFEPATLSLEG